MIAVASCMALHGHAVGFLHLHAHMVWGTLFVFRFNLDGPCEIEIVSTPFSRFQIWRFFDKRFASFLICCFTWGETTGAISRSEMFVYWVGID
jgi:hypothetical protein